MSPHIKIYGHDYTRSGNAHVISEDWSLDDLNDARLTVTYPDGRKFTITAEEDGIVVSTNIRRSDERMVVLPESGNCITVR